jgi:TPR repeat protein
MREFAFSVVPPIFEEPPAGRRPEPLAFARAVGLDPTDPAAAFVWYSRAAVAGDGRAMRALAIALEAGRGVRRDPAAALRWWRRAAAAGDTVARVRMAVIESQEEALLAEFAA